MTNIFNKFSSFQKCIFLSALFFFINISFINAQINSRQETVDSLKAIIETQKDNVAALNEYINILGYTNDTLNKQFDAWIKQFPKSASIPYALGTAYYKKKDRKAGNYFYYALVAGDTSKRTGQMMDVAFDEKWNLDVQRTANTIDSLKKVIENNPDSLLPLQQYIFVMSNNNDIAVNQLNAWIKQFPSSSAIVFATGEMYYNEESPKATPYLLKASELEPANAKLWEMLSIDAERLGDKNLALKYMGKATEAAPEDAEYAFYYAMDFEDVDTVIRKQKLWELVKKFPDNERGAQSLYWLAYRTQNEQEKLNTYEQLRKLYPPEKFDWSADGMNALFDMYLKDGNTDKAIELAQSMSASEGFPEKLELAKNVSTIRLLINQKKYADARKEIANLKLPRYSGVVNMITLLKSEVMDAAGSTNNAYDSLLVIEAKTPADDINAAIIKYGKKLGKDAVQTDKDVWTIRNKSSKPAPPFELGLYTSPAKVKLEDYKGKVVLLTFWFPGCGPCRGEMPHFQNVVKKFYKNQLIYLGINVLPDQDAYVLPFMKNTKFSFTPLRGNSEWAEETYHVRGEPTNFLIDQNGKIIYSNFMINANNERMLELMISSMLAHNPS